MTLRPVAPEDEGVLARILAEPEVWRWWNAGGDPDRTAEELISATDQVVLAIEVSGEVVGSVQFYEEDDPGYRHAGMDIFISTANQDRGLGGKTLRLLARHLLEERGHHRLVIDPRADNERAIHLYERIGFRRVGVMRRYERGSDGVWRDGLLMDLLAGELTSS